MDKTFYNSSYSCYNFRDYITVYWVMIYVDKRTGQRCFHNSCSENSTLMLTGGDGDAGLVMQLITQNRFVEPTTTGTIEWSGLGLFVYLLFPARL